MSTSPNALRFAIESSGTTNPFSPENQIDDGSSTGPSDPSGELAFDTFFGGFNSATSADASPALLPSAQREGAPADPNVPSVVLSSGSATSTVAAAGSAAAGAAAVGPAAVQADSVVTTPGSGLVFNNTWGSGATPAYENCVIAAEKQLEGIFTNNITLNITFNLGSTGGDHELSSVGGSFTYSYATLKAAILKAAPNDVLPSTDPSNGKGFTIPESYARMLGLSSSAPGNDATITLDGDISWDFGQDAVNAITHAITESAMGRPSGLGDFNNGIWTAMDLFRYTAAGVYDPTDGRGDPSAGIPAGAADFFSSAGGKQTSANAGLQFTHLFDGANPVSGPHNDPDDWTTSAVFGTTDLGATLTLAPTEVAEMNALGWTTSLQPQFFTASTGDWETFSNWSNGYNPISVEDVEIGYYSLVGANATLTGGADVTVNSITLNAHSTLTIEDSATLTATNGTVPNPADASVLPAATSTITVQDAFLEIGNSFENSGTLVVGTSSGDGIVRLIGGVTLDGGGTVDLGGLSVGFSADVVKARPNLIGPSLSPSSPRVTSRAPGALANVDETISSNGDIRRQPRQPGERKDRRGNRRL